MKYTGTRNDASVSLKRSTDSVSVGEFRSCREVREISYFLLVTLYRTFLRICGPLNAIKRDISQWRRPMSRFRIYRSMIKSTRPKTKNAREKCSNYVLSIQWRVPNCRGARIKVYRNVRFPCNKQIQSRTRRLPLFLAVTILLRSMAKVNRPSYPTGTSSVRLPQIQVYFWLFALAECLLIRTGHCTSGSTADEGSLRSVVLVDAYLYTR